MTEDVDKLPDGPADSKLTRTKRAWARAGQFLTGRSGTDRLPPSQHVVSKWPVLDLGRQPDIATDSWKLAVHGLVETTKTFDWPGFKALARDERKTDIHCVTSWSLYDNRWRGLSTQSLVNDVKPSPEARAVMVHCFDGYSTNLTLEDFAAPDSMLVHSWNGAPLERAHGGPVRLVVPHLYFWKSAKWVSRIEFIAADRPGFWEQNGYNMHGDPWSEQRYAR